MLELLDRVGGEPRDFAQVGEKRQISVELAIRAPQEPVERNRVVDLEAAAGFDERVVLGAFDRVRESNARPLGHDAHGHPSAERGVEERGARGRERDVDGTREIVGREALSVIELVDETARVLGLEALDHRVPGGSELLELLGMEADHRPPARALHERGEQYPEHVRGVLALSDEERDSSAVRTVRVDRIGHVRGDGDKLVERGVAAGEDARDRIGRVLRAHLVERAKQVSLRLRSLVALPHVLDHDERNLALVGREAEALLAVDRLGGAGDYEGNLGKREDLVDVDVDLGRLLLEVPASHPDGPVSCVDPVVGAEAFGHHDDGVSPSLELVCHRDKSTGGAYVLAHEQNRSAHRTFPPDCDFVLKKKERAKCSDFLPFVNVPVPSFRPL